MVRIGLVGIGFMGWIHFLAAQRLGAAGRVTAIASRDPKKRAGDWRGIQGNFGPPGQQVNLAEISVHATLEELLAQPDVDLIDLCLPTPQHVPAVRQCLRAGKHVLVEKPLALDPADALELAGLAADVGRCLMVAHVLPFFPEFQYACAAVRGGEYGSLLAANFSRIISRPDWSAAIADAQTTGGPIVDLHVHDTHLIRMLFGLPVEVRSTGVVGANGAVEHVQTQYLFGSEGPPSVASTCGALCMKGRPFKHGFELYFERMTLLHDSGTQPLAQLGADGGTTLPTFADGADPVAAFAAELRAAVTAVATGLVPPELSAAVACDALRLCRAEELSVRTGKPVSLCV